MTDLFTLCGRCGGHATSRIDGVVTPCANERCHRGYVPIGPAGTALAFEERTLDGKAQVRIALAEGVIIRGATYLLIPVTGGET